MGGEVKGKLGNGVGSQYPSHYLRMRTPRLPIANWRHRQFKWTRPFRRKTKPGFCACAITFQTQSTHPQNYMVSHSYCVVKPKVSLSSSNLCTSPP